MTDPTMAPEQVDAAVRAAAAATGVPHEVVPCDPALADTAAFVAAYGYRLDESANTILVVGKTEPPVYALCVVLADSRLDVNGLVRKRLGVRKCSFASADDTRAITGMEIGGVTPFAVPAGLPVWVDERIMAAERIVLGGGVRSTKVVGPPALLTALPGVEVVADLARPVAGTGDDQSPRGLTPQRRPHGV
jgi:prolyl-tRNA editing enzyme YbaK/EbsC (Cys-tRNA(Pro) deacylase)